MFISKLKVCFLFLALSQSAFCWTGLSTEIQRRTENYSFLSKHYGLLLDAISRENKELFCTISIEAYPTLRKILENDNHLISLLRQESLEHFHEYAVHLEENMISPLFSYNSYTQKCSSDQPTELSSLYRDMSYNLLNITFLKQNHDMWIKAYMTDFPRLELQ